MTHGNSQSDDEAKVRSVIDGWVKAIRSKDTDAVMAHYAADIVTFDLAPPLQTTGADGFYGRHWTPVHLDMVVADIEIAVTRAERAGAVPEREVQTHEWDRLAPSV